MSELSISAIRTKLKKNREALAAWFPALILTGILSFGGFFLRTDRDLYDLLLLIKTRCFPLALNAQIIHADLNDSSEARLGPDLDTRKAFADFLAVLGSYNSRVAFDFVFRAPAAGDSAFAEAARAANLCIMAIVPVEEEYANFAFDALGPGEKALLKANTWHIKEYGKNTIPRAKTFILSNHTISSSATQLAHIGVLPDGDGVFRRTPLFYRWEDGLVPAISLAVAVRELGIKPENIEFYPGRFLVLPLSEEEAIRVPVDKSGAALIPFTAPWADVGYRISFDRVAEAAHNEETYASLLSELSGSMIMVADTTTGKRDFGITPIETVYPLSGIHTAVLSGIIEEYFYRDWGRPARTAALVVLVIITFLLTGIKKDHLYFFIYLGLLAVFSAWTIAAWFVLRISPWYGNIAGGLVLFFAAGFSMRLFRRYREEMLLKSALSRYFPRSLAERIISEGKTELNPAFKELSILFTDISSFTNWSSDRDPALVHAFLSDYLETMAGIIFEHGGTVDKFMGDGILAFFGDPFEMPDHTRRCISAALAMQKKIRELAVIWAPKAGINLKVRMGINTGRVIVGNLGTSARIEYTVIGAAVNLGQRLESNAPVGGILVSRAVKEKAGNGFSFSEKRDIPVKGYDKPIEAYEVVSEPARNNG
ncbi:MAG: adenylate/guanylate cyclase domain-containing protein [Treponema sp.]|jgi:adenylate cyclase|nr:adenylate/guanylate cyclase domain-containing protein [Treponema sp.]